MLDVPAARSGLHPKSDLSQRGPPGPTLTQSGSGWRLTFLAKSFTSATAKSHGVGKETPPSSKHSTAESRSSNMDSVLPSQIAAAFKPILGRPAWQVKKGYGSFLTLEFCEPRLEIREPRENKHFRNRNVTVRGEWHLWVYCCDWKIVIDGKRLAHSESDEEAIAQATARLDGQCLKELWMEPETVVTHFQFDLGGILTTLSYDDDDDEPNEQWMLFEPLGNVLSVRSDHRFFYGSGDTPPAEQRWLPIFDIHDSRQD